MQQKQPYCQPCFVRMEVSIGNHYEHLRREVEKEGVHCCWLRGEIEREKGRLRRAEREELGALRGLCWSI